MADQYYYNVHVQESLRRRIVRLDREFREGWARIEYRGDDYQYYGSTRAELDVRQLEMVLLMQQYHRLFPTYEVWMENIIQHHRGYLNHLVPEGVGAAVSGGFSSNSPPRPTPGYEPQYRPSPDDDTTERTRTRQTAREWAENFARDFNVGQGRGAADYADTVNNSSRAERERARQESSRVGYNPNDWEAVWEEIRRASQRAANARAEGRSPGRRTGSDTGPPPPKGSKEKIRVTITKIERLARDPAATDGERQAAQAMAAKLRMQL